jgi:type II secretory pathway pseudopilin PulG
MTPLAISTVDVVLLVVLLVIALLATGGYVAATRRNRARERKLLDELQAAERALAQAHAADKGWDRALLESAARDAVAERFPGAQVNSMQLVQVLDRPGTDADQAIFRVETGEGDEHRITLGRTGGVWGVA